MDVNCLLITGTFLSVDLRLLLAHRFYNFHLPSLIQRVLSKSESPSIEVITHCDIILVVRAIFALSPFPLQIVSRNPFSAPLLKKDGKPMGGSTITVGLFFYFIYNKL